MSPMQSSFARAFLLMLAGPIIWAAHFLFIYSFVGVVCARPALHVKWMGAAMSSWVIVAASLLALAAMAVIYLRLRGSMPRTGDPAFLPWLAGTLSLLSAVAIIWETLPVLLVPPC